MERSVSPDSRTVKQIIKILKSNKLKKVVKRKMAIKTLLGESIDGIGAELDEIEVPDLNNDGKISVTEKIKAVIKNVDIFITIILSFLADPILEVLTLGFDGYWNADPIMKALKALVVPFIITFIFKSNEKKNKTTETANLTREKELNNKIVVQTETIKKQKETITALKVNVLLKDSEIKLYQNNVLNAENYKKMEEAIQPDIKTIKEKIQ